MKQIESGHLNAICPYFTMFPLKFPYAILRKHAQEGQWVLDPFCGRGTTNYASRLLRLPTIGIDSSPVASALSEAKIANATPDQIVDEVGYLLEEVPTPSNIPDSDFWQLAYEESVLEALCRLREGLLESCETDSRKALRAIILGALHGPRGKLKQSYFSNQSQRTYAPKPSYAVRYWREREMYPERVDVMGIIKERAERYYGNEKTRGRGRIIQGDSRDVANFATLKKPVDWIITSPPYYGMRTYLPDQWIRLWFVGGEPEVVYTNEDQLEHGSPEEFVKQLRQVWRNAATVANHQARMVIRFGAINNRNIDPASLFKESIRDSGWRTDTVIRAGTAANGRRQALHMTANDSPKLEYDLWATLTN